MLDYLIVAYLFRFIKYFTGILTANQVRYVLGYATK